MKKHRGASWIGTRDDGIDEDAEDMEGTAAVGVGESSSLTACLPRPVPPPTRCPLSAAPALHPTFTARSFLSPLSQGGVGGSGRVLCPMLRLHYCLCMTTTRPRDSNCHLARLVCPSTQCPRQTPPQAFARSRTRASSPPSSWDLSNLSTASLRRP